MNLSPAWLDELRARITLSTVIAPSVKLVRAGREFKACCPFHNEKTPSFTINDEKHFYHCFGCGAHGDAIRFLTDHRGMQFIDAVNELAAKAGLEVPVQDERFKEQADRLSTLTGVLNEAALWYAQQLAGALGADARNYLFGRGINPHLTAQFGLGYAPENRTSLKRALEHVGAEKLIEAGMLIAPEEPSRESYDRFRGRLMIPIRDARRRVIGFGGRIIGQGEPKYLNSPQTVVFDKGRTLYNVDRAGSASRTAKRLIVVEGYMDVIALESVGISEVLAPNGTALTEAQLERLWQLDPSPLLCFDGDSAGRKAAIRAAMRALPLLRPARTLRFVELPPGMDPDDVIRAGGRQAFESILETAEPLDAKLWRHELEAQPLTTPEAWAGLKERLVSNAAAIGHGDLARIYREDWLKRFYDERRPQTVRADPTFTPGKRGTFKNGRYVPPPAPVDAQARAIASGGIDGPTARALLLGFANYPDELVGHCEQLASLPIADRQTAKIRDELVNLALAGTVLDHEGISTILAKDGAMGGKARRAMGFSFTRRDSDPDRARSDLAAAVEIIAAAEEVEKAIGHATEQLKRDFTEEALEEQQRLMAAQRGLRERLAQLAGTD